jgi:3-hydroxybutyryl-CoA dehydrogenase
MPLTFDPNSQSFTLGVIGSGAMGRGIAQIAAQAGLAVRLHDSNQQALTGALESIESTLNRLVEKGKMDAAKAGQAIAAIKLCNALSDLVGCDLIVEAIVENLAVKQQLFAQLEPLIDQSTVLASNTSSLSVTAIAAGMQHPERLLGWHFFNPVPLMRVVEVVDGARSDAALGDGLMLLSKRLGHTPVRAKDTPGFIVNHAGRAFGTEALRIVGEGVCGFEDVDRVMREACGFRLGPFELMDLTGLDVSHPVMESIYHQYYEEPRFRPSVIAAQRYAAGLFGKKTGMGFYDYREGHTGLLEAAAPTERPGLTYVAREFETHHAEVSSAIAGHTALTTDPAAADLCIVMPIGQDATSLTSTLKLDPAKTVAIDMLTLHSKRRTLMTNPLTTTTARLQGHALFAADGTPVTVIRDSAGFIAQRIIAMIVNVASEIAQQGIATPADIDLAVQLGLAYPRGPLALGDAYGPSLIDHILRNLQHESGDPRYRPSAWLTRRALLGVSLATVDQFT